MRITPSHVYFWFGPFSNWFKPCYFSGQDALGELLPRLRHRDWKIPAESHPSTVLIANHRFHCGEQWMMAIKAWIFGDDRRLKAILQAWEPKEHKSLGRSVSDFDPEIWEDISVDVVVSGSISRFGSNSAILSELLATGDRVLVEGSPYDRVWGVGLKFDDPKIEDPRNWRGRNLLGVALVEARDELRRRNPNAPKPPERRRFSRG